MFPLESAPLPGGELALQIFEPRYRELVSDCLRGDRRFGVVLIARGREVGGGDQRCEVGVIATIDQHRKLGLGRYALQCGLGERIRVSHWLPDDPYPLAEVELWPDEAATVDVAELQRVQERIVALFERVAASRGRRPPSRNAILGVNPDGDTGKLLYHLASRVPMGAADRYGVLAAPSPADRLAALNEGIDTVTAMVEFGSR